MTLEDAKKYLEEALDLVWGYDIDYCRTFQELKECWECQNILRSNNELELLTEQNLQDGRGGKP